MPNQVALVPLLQALRRLGINGTFLAVWLAHIGFGMPLAIYILRNYMSTLPKAIIESAKIDGASHFHDVLAADHADVDARRWPRSRSSSSSGSGTTCSSPWSSSAGRQHSRSPSPCTVCSGQQGQGWQLLTAGGVLTIIVPLIVFLSLQRYFVRGMTAGAVKG